ncbi:MAG: cbb3-type cytochrome c oxidase subunit I [Acidobacteriaceae bacterium]
MEHEISNPSSRVPPSLLRSIVSTDHRAIGRQYLALALAAVAVGTVLSLMMRLHLVWPEVAVFRQILPEDYLALVTLHGTLMVFFVLTVAPQSGFGNLILPAQIGTDRMAFPALNAASFWITAAGLLSLLSSILVPAGAAISGWTAYPPLSAVAAAGPGQGPGMDLWLASIALFSIGATLGAINTLTTVVRLRCEGMTWERLPLTVWGWLTSALLSILAFSVLLAALLLLFCDRHAGTSFFLPTGDLVNGALHAGRGNGTPLLWLHLFWFFGHPEVYIAILPGMGLTSMLLATFARRRVFAYRTMIATTLLIGFLGILVWGHHMFVAGLNPFAGTAFSISTIAIALPASAKVLSWIATVWRSRPKLTTPMLFALGFVSLFITGGLTGPILAQPILDEYLHNTFFVVAHFHLIMAMAGTFGIFAATYFWFPLLTSSPGRPGRLMSERLGKWHFWLTIFLAYSTFLPMHFTGLAGEPRQYAQLTGIPAAAAARLLAGTLPLNRDITISAILLGCVQLLFLFNLARSWFRGDLAKENPWSATTLEWHPAFSECRPASRRNTESTTGQAGALEETPPPEESVAVYREPCEYDVVENRYLPQWFPESNPSKLDPTRAE